MNPLESIAVVHEEQIPQELFDTLREDLSLAHTEPYIEKVPNRGSYAGIEEYLPTAVMVLLAKPFFDAFLKKAGEDSYELLKKALVRFVKKAAEINVESITSVLTPKKVDPSYPFSRCIAIHSKLGNNPPVKFLIHTGKEEEYYSSAVSSLLEIIKSDNLPAVSEPPSCGIYVFVFDERSRSWMQKTRKVI